MMMEEDHVKAVSSNTTPITTPKSDPTSETQTIPDSITKQAFASLGDNQLDKLTLVLQGLAGLIETQPLSAHLLLTATSDEAKKPQSSSNRGRNADDLPEHTSICSVPIVQMGAILGANSTTPEQDGSRCIDQQRGRWLVIEYLAGILASIDPVEIPSSVKTVDW
jgi:hypothetical protein